MKDIDNEFNESFKNEEIDIGELFKIIFARRRLFFIYFCSTILGFSILNLLILYGKGNLISY